MNALSFILFGVGMVVVMCKRSIVELVCGLQIVALGLLSFTSHGDVDSHGLSFVILICSGFFAAIGVSVLIKSGMQSEDESETQ